jgi:hypothetical protein
MNLFFYDIHSIYKTFLNQYLVCFILFYQFLKLIVNYDNLRYTSVDEVPAMNLNRLLGNLGGQLGLFWTIYWN